MRKQILLLESIYALHIVCNIHPQRMAQNVFKIIFTECFW